MATRGVHIETKIVFETRISTWTRSRRIKMQRCIVTSCERAFIFTPLKRLILLCCNRCNKPVKKSQESERKGQRNEVARKCTGQRTPCSCGSPLVQAPY